MEKIRGFEKAKGFENYDLTMPIRKTKYSAGYDICAAEDCVIPPFSFGSKPTLVKTGLKAYMQNDEYLMLCNRSSNPFKKGLVMANSIGIIDSDYYGNDKNEGEIFVQLINYGLEDYTIKKGDRIAQGIFTPYATVDREDKNLSSRTGGFGSSGKN